MAYECDFGVDQSEEVLFVPVTPCVGLNGVDDKLVGLVVELPSRPGLVCEPQVEIYNGF